ncbi:protein-L-isoaspartate O-methyltransferas-like protein [Cucurbitaria berberidis CBS 394.84]|uniref:Protein-L-isoaspartate O-methyltransferase n=1 Tax=Cucurbitaria berberidis CBS 394.84 TaxID=1168544 RepID=A0A9P4GEA6_9PLEO|nr:protein-L-isoaspartate O-methyltransferas-like protein [Cucurbitaria berberidis CBS 394.84]KAF1843731.1 protein-L-isoaspartate O-methyltransferas-like protein [Cucurbitaria berberidis CBS 394.84]
MAWRSSGESNEALITNLARNGLIKTDRVKEAMLKVDRAHYAPSSAYKDCPQPIGHRATISAPHMHASACESLLEYLQPGSKVLDIGSGSGYLTAVLANLVGPSGSVIGIDHIQPLVDLANTNMAKSEQGRNMLESGQVKFVTGDGRKGWKEGAPYDAIHVGAAAAEHHQELTDQLKAPGRLFVPVEEDNRQHIYVLEKKEDGSVERKKLYGVQYVPLTDAPK